MYIDSHAHLSPADTLLSEKLLNAMSNDVSSIVNVACMPEDWEPYITLAKTYEEKSPSLHTSLGIHPDFFNTPEASRQEWENKLQCHMASLATQVEEEPVVAIGECGLDYYRTPHKEAQRALFIAQLQLARAKKLPCILHIREAFEDCFDILSSFKDITCIFHCFTGNKETASYILKHFPNAFISFSGIVTFKNASEIQEAAIHVPIEHMLVETDCPYLAPEPMRGKENEPAYVIYTAHKIAELKTMGKDEIAQATTENAKKIFSL